MRRNPRFKSDAESTDRAGVSPGMHGVGELEKSIRRRHYGLGMKAVSFAAAKNRAHARPGVRGKAGGGHWIAKGEGSERGTNGTLMRFSIAIEDWDGRVF